MPRATAVSAAPCAATERNHPMRIGSAVRAIQNRKGVSAAQVQAMMRALSSIHPHRPVESAVVIQYAAWTSP